MLICNFQAENVKIQKLRHGFILILMIPQVWLIFLPWKQSKPIIKSILQKLLLSFKSLEVPIHLAGIYRSKGMKPLNQNMHFSESHEHLSGHDLHHKKLLKNRSTDHLGLPEGEQKEPS